MPQYEVPVTETPGLRPEDRPAMREMVDKGYLDMEVLAGMDRADLVAALSILVKDYAEWIDEQRKRVGVDVVGYDAQASAALDRCAEIVLRLDEGIAVLANEGDAKALEAFRFANRAMARQRVRGIYALEASRREKTRLTSTIARTVPGARSSSRSCCFPFRRSPTRSIRIARARSRRLPICSGSRRAAARPRPISASPRSRWASGACRASRRARWLARPGRDHALHAAPADAAAVPARRHAALRDGVIVRAAEARSTLGQGAVHARPVGRQRVTPGTTETAHQAIEAIRDKDRNRAGIASPAQLTSCPWCGSEISAGARHRGRQGSGRTIIYCGDKLGSCEFSQGEVERQRRIPGCP